MNPKVLGEAGRRERNRLEADDTAPVHPLLYVAREQPDVGAHIKDNALLGLQRHVRRAGRERGETRVRDALGSTAHGCPGRG